MQSDNEIVETVLSGNEENYRELVLRYQQKVYSVALKITYNKTDAEDITQEVFIQAYKSLSSFKFNSQFSTWIYRIAVNKCLDWKRKYKNQVTEININDEIDLSKSKDFLPEEIVLQKNSRSNINHMLEKLPTTYKSVIILYYFKELSYQEIAKQLHISKKTVESRLYRGKILLRKIADEEDLEWIVK